MLEPNDSGGIGFWLFLGRCEMAEPINGTKEFADETVEFETFRYEESSILFRSIVVGGCELMGRAAEDE